MNYKIEAIKILLDKECILERYYPLIPFKHNLINRFKKEKIITKDQYHFSKAKEKYGLDEDYVIDSVSALSGKIIFKYDILIRIDQLMKIINHGIKRNSLHTFDHILFHSVISVTQNRLYIFSHRTEWWRSCMNTYHLIKCIRINRTADPV